MRQSHKKEYKWIVSCVPRCLDHQFYYRENKVERRKLRSNFCLSAIKEKKSWHLLSNWRISNTRGERETAFHAMFFTKTCHSLTRLFFMQRPASKYNITKETECLRDSLIKFYFFGLLPALLIFLFHSPVWTTKM